MNYDKYVIARESGLVTLAESDVIRDFAKVIGASIVMAGLCLERQSFNLRAVPYEDGHVSNTLLVTMPRYKGERYPLKFMIAAKVKASIDPKLFIRELFVSNQHGIYTGVTDDAIEDVVNDLLTFNCFGG